MSTRFARAATVAMLVAGGGSCTHGATPRQAARQPEVVLEPVGAEPARVKVELAKSEAETQRGLMFRDHLDEGRGMLFFFERPRRLEFWMHNTYVSLDMIFIGSDRRVVGVVERAQPLTDEPRSVEGISQFVLEVPAGYAAAHKIAPGTPARFVDVD